jgi:hypothetical protein
LPQRKYLGRGKLLVGEELLHRFAAQQLHHQVRLTVLLAHIVNTADIGVI